MTQDFGTTARGETIHRMTITSGPLRASVLTIGGALQDVRLAALPYSLTVGSPDPSAYQTGMQHCGTIMGPVANRIGNAHAGIDGETYRFDRNFLDQHTLHGGVAATHRKLWSIADTGPTHATLTLALPAGEGGFPGNRLLVARYDIADTTLSLALSATTDTPTLINLANHSYWNLGPSPTTQGHHLTVHADHYLPTDQSSTLPTGEIAPVAGTRFDYRTPRLIQAGAEGLLDNNFCLSETRSFLRDIATLTGPTGTTMRMSSTEPGLQVFDGHILHQPDRIDMDGNPPRAYAGLALEAQFWPDAPNHPDFPAILLRPGEDWQQLTTWSFAP